ncbi:hypothetical protein [Pseudomonas sp. LF052]
MKDRIIWCGCAFLFGSGFVAGKMSGNTDFFRVANIHDLFEIAGAGATVIAASAAVVAMGSWRNQFIYGEKYKAVRDFHAACKSCMDSYFYVSLGYSLLSDVWANKGAGDWFHDQTDAARKEMIESDDSRYGAFVVLQHHLSDDEIKVIYDSYWQFVDEARSGYSEVISFSSQCGIMIDEPIERYEEFMIKGVRRCDAIMAAASELQIKADELFAKYARPI